MRLCRLLTLPEGQRPFDTVKDAVAATAPVRLSRQKLGRCLGLWESATDPVQLLLNPPNFVAVGRHGWGCITESQKHDLALWVRAREQMNANPSRAETVAQISHMIAVNRGLSPTTQGEDMVFTEAQCEEATGVYLRWRKWVAANMPSDYRLSSRVHKGVRQIEVAVLTPGLVERDLESLRQMLLRHGIMDPTGNIVVPNALWACDEKGFNDDKLAGSMGLTTKGGGRPSSAIGKALRHISVLTTVSASGLACPAAVTLAGSMYHEKWASLWPEAHLEATPKGSFTSRTFVVLLAETFCKHLRAVATDVVSPEQTIVLLLDSGGGREGMHKSLEFALVCRQYRIDPFVLAAYTTRAMMPLDREPHRQMEIRWGQLRHLFAVSHQKTIANAWQALPLCKAAWEHGTSERFILAGWRDCGISPWDPSRLLKDQAASLFRNVPKEESSAAAFLHEIAAAAVLA